jgi:hypothetical protein
VTRRRRLAALLLVSAGIARIAAGKAPERFNARLETSKGLVDRCALYAEYGETAGGGIRAGKQCPLFDGGNAYLDREFPKLDRIIRATIER